MRKIHFADHLEKKIAEALESAGIEFIHENEIAEQFLDFYLPAYDVFIEVKQFHAERIGRQMGYADNVIAVQGSKAVDFLIDILNKLK